MLTSTTRTRATQKAPMKFERIGVFTRILDGLYKADRIDQARLKSQSLTFPYTC